MGGSAGVWLGGWADTWVGVQVCGWVVGWTHGWECSFAGIMLNFGVDVKILLSLLWTAGNVKTVSPFIWATLEWQILALKILCNSSKNVGLMVQKSLWQTIKLPSTMYVAIGWEIMTRPSPQNTQQWESLYRVMQVCDPSARGINIKPHTDRWTINLQCCRSECKWNSDQTLSKQCSQECKGNCDQTSHQQHRSNQHFCRS